MYRWNHPNYLYNSEEFCPNWMSFWLWKIFLSIFRSCVPFLVGMWTWIKILGVRIGIAFQKMSPGDEFQPAECLQMQILPWEKGKCFFVLSCKGKPPQNALCSGSCNTILRHIYVTSWKGRGDKVWWFTDWSVMLLVGIDNGERTSPYTQQRHPSELRFSALRKRPFLKRPTHWIMNSMTLLKLWHVNSPLKHYSAWLPQLETLVKGIHSWSALDPCLEWYIVQYYLRIYLYYIYIHTVYIYTHVCVYVSVYVQVCKNIPGK